MEDNRGLGNVVKLLVEIYKSVSKIEQQVIDDSTIHKEAVTALKYLSILIKICGGSIPSTTEKKVSVKKPIFRVVAKKE